MHKDKLKTSAPNKAYKDGLAAIDWSVGRKEREAAKRAQKAKKAAERSKLQVIKDIDPFIDPIEGKVIGGNRQKREFMKRHGVIDIGDERIQQRKTLRPAVGPDIKRAIEELQRR